MELEDEVQEFEPNQDAETRQVLSVQVVVSEVRSHRPSTRLVLAMNSMDVGRRKGPPGVIDTTNRCTAWGSAYRQTRIERGIGHAISVAPESEVYRFGTAGLLTSTERVVYLCLSSSSDDHLLSHRCLGTGMRFGTQNKFCHYRASLVHSVSLIVS